MHWWALLALLIFIFALNVSQPLFADQGATTLVCVQTF
jgi:hypothetical protein